MSKRSSEYGQLLDAFSHKDIERDLETSDKIQKYISELYYSFESQRSLVYDNILESLQSAATTRVDLENWGRIVEYRYSLDALNPIGSIKNVGGRFNYGEVIDINRFTPFKALYLASDFETALSEKFGKENKDSTQLNRAFYSLKVSTSATWVRVSGNLTNVLDIEDKKSLLGFISIIKNFTYSSSMKDIAEELHKTLPPIVKTYSQLKIALLENDWQRIPYIANVPVNSQVFGKMLLDAGIEAVKYPSVRGKGKCLAIFPDNISDDSVVAVADPSPEGASLTLKKNR